MGWILSVSRILCSNLAREQVVPGYLPARRAMRVDPMVALRDW
jgi:ABC-type lipoprotein release transport system permease subunit